MLADCTVKNAYNINDFALNPTLDETYTVLQSVLNDITAASGTTTLHLGGDEVVYGCWRNDASIVKFMN